MIITCGQCRTKFKLDRTLIKESGSKVRCSNCQNVFTVYRTPQAQPQPIAVENGRTASPGKRDDGFDKSRAAAPTANAVTASEYAADEDELFEENTRQKVTAADLKQRRLARRRLYSDLEEKNEDPYDDEDLDELFNDDFADEDFSDSGKPPLRRPSARQNRTGNAEEDINFADDEPNELPHKASSSRAAHYTDDDLDMELNDADFNEHEINHQTSRTALKKDKGSASSLQQSFDISPAESNGASVDEDNLGLGMNPVSHDFPEPQPEQHLALDDKEAGQKKAFLILGLAILAAVLSIGIYIMASWPEKVDPSDLQVNMSAASPALPGGDIGTEPEKTDANSNDDSKGASGIVFLSNSYHHSFKNSEKAGKLFIITGMIKNNYPEPRSYIRLRGSLLGPDGRVLSERYFYAGNLISEEDLSVLPIGEITARLLLRGGQNGLNKNVEPGKEIPFMVVFNNLPEDKMDSYQLDAISSSPGE